MDKLKDFYNKLESLRKPKPSAEDYACGDTRVTHCYLKLWHNDEWHRFEVRGWTEVKNNEFTISVVNWTLCAGTAWLELTNKNVNDYIISEDR